jgi:spore maturation protein SpmB
VIRDILAGISLWAIPVLLVGIPLIGLIRKVKVYDDSLLGRTAATMYGSSETTFFVLAVYFGAVSIKRTRHAVPAALIGDVVAAVAAVLICRWMF